MYIQAILGRKLLINQIYEIMNKVAQLSITSESENVQLQCRKVTLYHTSLCVVMEIFCKGCLTIPTGLSVKEETSVLPQSLYI